MIKLRVQGDMIHLQAGISLLASDLNYELVSDSPDCNVKAIHSPGRVEIVYEHPHAKIYYGERIHFYRALGLLLEHMKRSQSSFRIKETPCFKTSGMMFDVSRNAVLKPETIKYFLRRLAVMGLDTVMLYTEDTYELEDYPYFGYMRGRYTADEIKDVDHYASQLGIELIPCIQLLGHLSHVLKWKAFSDVKDTIDILLVEEEKTYTFIEDVLRTISSMFSSNRIHIGMDEAHMLGRGAYFDKHGHQDAFHLFTNHLGKVTALCERYQLKPMIWSDMFFRIASDSGNYYDANAIIPQAVIDQIPKNLQLVYWDYYHKTEADYQSYIQIHKTMQRDILFAGGIWTWTGPAVMTQRSLDRSTKALSACKQEGITEVFATAWNDDGAETSLVSTLLVLQMFAEQTYQATVDYNELAERFAFCCGVSYDDFLKLDSPNFQQGGYGNPSKYLLWQDIMLGLFDKHIEGIDVDHYYIQAGKQLTQLGNIPDMIRPLFEVAYHICHVLEIKGRMGIKLKDAYDQNDRSELWKLLSSIPILIERVEQLRIAHRSMWMTYNKAFGWEVLDVRYGGVKIRLESAYSRIHDYLDGRIDSIEELEAPRLYIDYKRENVLLERELCYRTMYSACEPQII